MSHDRTRERLSEVLDTLEDVYATQRERLAQAQPSIAPEAMLDTHGAPILAPILAALVTGYAALLVAPSDTGGYIAPGYPEAIRMRMAGAIASASRD